MIEFLKDSTFTVNEVIQKAWSLTKKHYFSIATLCFLMFVTSNASSLMAFFLKEVNKGLSILMAILFVMIYFTINLSLFRYVFHLLDEEDKEVTIISTIPTKRQIIRFLIATLYFVLCIIGVYFIVALVAFPFIYTGIKMDLITNVAVSVDLIAVFITWLRISFFPFFILDKEAKPFKSIKMSLAITKGNFIKILMLLVVLGGFHILYLFLSYLHWPILAFVVNILSSFIIVPLTAVSLTIAYRKMMSEYKGDADPDILHNIV